MSTLSFRAWGIGKFAAFAAEIMEFSVSVRSLRAMSQIFEAQARVNETAKAFPIPRNPPIMTMVLPAKSLLAGELKG